MLQLSSLGKSFRMVCRIGSPMASSVSRTSRSTKAGVMVDEGQKPTSVALRGKPGCIAGKTRCSNGTVIESFENILPISYVYSDEPAHDPSKNHDPATAIHHTSKRRRLR